LYVEAIVAERIKRGERLQAGRGSPDEDRAACVPIREADPHFIKRRGDPLGVCMDSVVISEGEVAVL
jgi:hypothetical protein